MVTCAVFTFPAWELLVLRFGATQDSLKEGGKWNRPFSANDNGNFATMQVLVERGTWSINHSPIPTTDWALIDGRRYSVRPPVLPFLASGVYWVFHRIFGLQLSHKPDFVVLHYVLVLAFSGLATALGAVLISRSVALIAMENFSDGLGLIG